MEQNFLYPIEAADRLNSKEYNRRRVVLLNLIVAFSFVWIATVASGQFAPHTSVNGIEVQTLPESPSIVFNNPRNATVAYTINPEELMPLTTKMQPRNRRKKA